MSVPPPPITTTWLALWAAKRIAPNFPICAALVIWLYESQVAHSGGYSLVADTVVGHRL
jgi:hypothetical protein